jgi:NAD(P)-dependent dehydrogenase (short-subunit alcohol dehydrogenase family)
LSDAGTVQILVDELVAARGGLHTVVNAAGAPIAQPYISQADPETFRGVIEGDLAGFFNLVHACLPHLRSDGGGSVVAITSAGLKRFPPGDILSVAPKAGIEALVRGIAREEGRYGVRANCVALGVIEAGMFLKLREAELDETWQEAAKANTPLRRFGTAEEVAEAAVFLASTRAGYITGQTLMLDGGYTI